MTKRIGYLLCVLVVALLPVLYASTANVEAAAPVEVRSEMLVSTAWLAENLEEPDVVVLCIAGKPEFYSGGHIPGARLVMLSDITVTRNGVPSELPSTDDLKKVFESAGVTDTSRIVLYGEHSGLLAARAYWTLDYLGLGDRASLLDGGLEKWMAEGRAVSQETPQVEPGQLSIFANPDVLAGVQDVAELVKDPVSGTLIDARPADEFNGSKLSADVAKAGHIPRARGIYWMKNIESAENPVLRPEAELRQMYAEAGAAQSKRVVTYCRTGMQASFDYFVARYLGYNAAVYVYERKDLPAESDVKPPQKAPEKK